MVPYPKLRGPRLRDALCVILAAGVSLQPALAAPAFPLFETRSPLVAERAPAPRIHVAQNQQSAAQLMVRIQDLEDQIRTLTGQVEGLQFQLTQMQTLLERQAEDNEFRFQQLEGGAVGKPQAAAPTDGATPSDILPQDPTTAGQPQEQLPALTDDAPMDFALGDSADPLLNGGSDSLGEIDPDSFPDLGPGQPLDLTLPGAAISDGDARAQYDAGYEAITRGDYAFAEEQFGQFVALYPDDPQVPDAINYLGEALIQRGAYTDAAQILADGYTRYRESRRAPDMMLKLGVALAGAEQVEVACRTFSTLVERYPDLSPAFRQRLEAENQKAQCPAG